jgi:hypothetical protein
MSIYKPSPCGLTLISCSLRTAQIFPHILKYIPDPQNAFISYKKKLSIIFPLDVLYSRTTVFEIKIDMFKYPKTKISYEGLLTVI